MSERLAINGGTPVRETMLPYGRQSIDEGDMESVMKVLRSDWLTTGPKVREFEQRFASSVGAAEAVAVSSGTAALHVAACGAGIGPEDEVITTPLTFAATANCILYLGGRPVFADVCPDTLNIDPGDVAKKITPKTRAVIAVDFAGQPCDYDGLRAITERNGLLLIADACHALGAAYKERSVGSLADLSTFSFHPVKHITTGEGGMVVTDDPDRAARMRAFRNHGITTEFRQRAEAATWLYEMRDLGFNYRLPDINCALGLSQLGKLDGWLERRRVIAGRYSEAFSEIPALELPKVPAEVRHSWHLCVILLNLDHLKVGRKEIFEALRAENIGVNVHYIPVYWHPYYRDLGYRKGLCPNAEAAYERLISLPIFPAMSDEDVEDVISAVSKVIESFHA